MEKGFFFVLTDSHERYKIMSQNVKKFYHLRYLVNRRNKFGQSSCYRLFSHYRVKNEVLKARGKMNKSYSSRIITERQFKGNLGMFLVCAELSKHNLIAMPTSRNTKGYDIVVLNPRTNRA